MPTREAIVAKAREYVGTPFQHQGRLRGKALDCVGLVLCVGQDLNMVGADGQPVQVNDYVGYPAQPVNSTVYEECCKRLVKKSEENMKPGDVISLRIPATPTHVAIVSEVNGELYMIHAYDSGPRKCVEHILNMQWRRRIAGVFEFPGVTD